METVSKVCSRLASRSAAAENWEDSERWLRRAMLFDGGRGDLHYRLGRIAERRGDAIGAAHCYRSAIARDPSRAQWHFRLGEALKASGEWDAAAHAHRLAEKLGPELIPRVKGRPGKQLRQMERIQLGVVRKPVYAYGLFRAAQLAQRLGIPRISAIELGVAGGNGLVALERHASDIRAMFDIDVDVYGLDTGEGMPPPEDERDLSYHFAPGNYAMDQQKLRDKLTNAELILGDATQTFPQLLQRPIAPIGFLSFDMDYYTPTAGVHRHLGDAAADDVMLPRTPLYYDDVVSDRNQSYTRFTGELLAIDEFNVENERVKIDEDRHFRSLPINAQWHHGCFTMHRFSHPLYDKYVNSAGRRSLSLKD